MGVTGEMIFEGLHRSGLKAGDRVLVHSSLKSFGRVDGGAETVIEALMRVITENGTILMPTFTLSNMSAERPVFDVLRSPSEVGKITEVFRRREDTCRSLHITHSVSAWGKEAEGVASMSVTSAWGKDSPFQWLLDRDGKILMLGTDYNTCTLIHKAEEDLQIPYREMTSYPGSSLILSDGKVISNSTKVYVRKEGVVSDWSAFIAELKGKHSGIAKQVQIGQASVSVVGARELYDITVRAIRQNAYALVKEPGNS